MVAIVDPGSQSVVLVGAAGAGKSTLAARLFATDEIVSSDALRAVISGDEADQRVSGVAFRILHRTVGTTTRRWGSSPSSTRRTPIADGPPAAHRAGPRGGPAGLRDRARPRRRRGRASRTPAGRASSTHEVDRPPSRRRAPAPSMATCWHSRASTRSSSFDRRADAAALVDRARAERRLARPRPGRSARWRRQRGRCRSCGRG